MFFKKTMEGFEEVLIALRTPRTPSFLGFYNFSLKLLEYAIKSLHGEAHDVEETAAQFFYGY